MKKSVFFLFTILTIWGCKQPDHTADKDLARYVVPHIGTGGHGHVFLGANVPFGAVQLGPVNMSEGWDWCSGYNYADSTIIGFSHTRLSGTGIGDLGDILLMPVTGEVKPVKGTIPDYSSGYYSLFSHDKEKVSPGYYDVWLDRYDIRASLTATTRTGWHRYEYPAGSDAGLIIDLKEGVGWDKVTASSLRQINDSTLQGYRYSTGWAPDQRIYFSMVFSQPVATILLYEDTIVVQGKELEGVKVKAHVTFRNLKDNTVMVKVGISPVSAENAWENIAEESPGWAFEKTATQARRLWNNELNKIQIESTDTSRLRTFYTAMYHTMMAPAIFNDASGDYRGTDKKVYLQAGHTNMTVFSLWDTYRAANPYYTLIQQERVADMINSMLAIYQQQGRLPVWHLAGNETNTMPGNSAIPVIADAFLKGITGFDTSLAWEAVSKTQLRDERGLAFIREQGFIPADSMIESVAMALEYAIADAGIALMAKKMGKEKEYNYFYDRALAYHRYYDPSVGFMRGKTTANTWRTPFSPFEAKHMKDDFCEGNAWQYTWLVPQDVEGLMQMLGGENRFTHKLDSLFLLTVSMGKEASGDITGLIGQYAHGNEPGHHIPYLYAYAGQPWKTAEKVRYILDSLYSDTPEGICGNEDAGQMSAWYILSALGLYQVNPSQGLFVVGSPVVDKATIQTGKGKYFTIAAKNNSADNKYIQRMKLNGKEIMRSYITYAEINAGGELIMEMGATPSATFGISLKDRPYSALTNFH